MTSAKPSKARRFGAWLLLALVAFAAWLAWPRLEREGTPLATGSPVAGDAGAINLEQGWSAQTQANAWFTSFGSRLLPYAWFLHLEQAGSAAPFRDDAHLRALGFLPASASPMNPDALPVGVARNDDDGGTAWVGLGCAACHTGELRFGTTRLRIAGGAGRIDLQAFELDLLRALRSTRDDPRKYARFAAALHASGQGIDALRAQLAAQVDRLERRIAMNRTIVAYGPGRMDAFGQIFNAVGVDALGIEANAHAPDAPVSIPVLWDAPRLSAVQWNGSSPNGGIATLAQNVTTALGVYGDVHVGDGGAWGYDSNADFATLGRIQQWNNRLQAPRWPEAVFGKLDAARVQRGETLYRVQCESCHHRDAAKPEVVLVSIDDVGTDPLMADNFATREGATGALRGRPSLVFGGAPFGERARMIDLVVHLTVGAMARHPLAAARAAIAGHASAPDAPKPADPRVYKARPLDGIWASAPYLHNGSVPTLADLLLPPTDRPTVFTVGNPDFDPARVGLAATTPGAVFDTRLRGNANGGHPYGTGLDAAQRRDLLEYLKSL